MNKIPIAKIGKTHGIKGWQKLHILTDFPEQFRAGSVFSSDKITLTIDKIDLKKGLVKFKGIETPEDAKKLVNRKLYTTEKETKQNIKLKKNEYFWFDIIGCEVFEDIKPKTENETIKKIKLGKVIEIERADVDYLVIATEKSLIDEGYPKRFLIDFKRHVKDVDVNNKIIISKGAFEILESLK